MKKWFRGLVAGVVIAGVTAAVSTGIEWTVNDTSSIKVSLSGIQTVRSEENKALEHDGQPYTAQQVITLNQPVTMTELSSKDLLEMVAHRGYQGYPENTLPAFEASFELGAHTIELDIHHTADGVPVVMHDATIDRTTNGTGNVKDLTLAQLKTFDAGSKLGSEWAGTTVPTLDEVLRLSQGKGKMQIELKERNTSEQIQNMIDLVSKYEMRDKVMFISFYIDNLKAIRKIDSNIEIGLLGAKNLYWAPVLRDLGKAYALNNYKVWQANPGWVQTFRQAGVGCGAWTIKKPEIAQEMIKLGVMKITTDIPLKVRWEIGQVQ